MVIVERTSFEMQLVCKLKMWCIKYSLNVKKPLLYRILSSAWQRSQFLQKTFIALRR